MAVLGGLAIFTGCIFNFNAGLAAVGVGRFVLLSSELCVCSYLHLSLPVHIRIVQAAGTGLLLFMGGGVVRAISNNLDPHVCLSVCICMWTLIRVPAIAPIRT